MGCETDVPSEEPEAAHSLVVTSLETKRNDIFEDSKSVTIYNRLGLGISKMATGNLKDFESECHERLGLVNEALNCNDIDGYESNVHNKGLTENQSVANKRNEGQSDPDIGDQIKKAQSNMTEQGESNRAENLNETTTEVHTNASEKELDPLNSLTIKLPVTNDSQDEGSSSSGGLSDVKIREEILNNLEILKDRLKTATDIPSILLDVSLSSLKPSTIEYMSYHLDPQSDVMSPEDKLKDYRGMAEWIGLEPVFIKYISRSPYMLKTKEVLSKWLTLEEEPLPTLKNLRTCLLAIDRPDVLEDMSVKIALDAVTWKKTQIEAQTKKEVRVDDTSWQLTRHDVVSGKKTMYTACLLYADEDELMAQVITKLYKTAYKDTLFFLPQFDLKQGKYVLDTTARVIDERCDKKVIFLLSEYFYASDICQFAVNYAAAHGTGNGNLIPFHLTRNVSTVPNVLKGIAGIRWFRKGTRQHTWQILADCLLAEKVENELLLGEIKVTIEKMIAKDPEYYLQDPPYDDDIDPPGVPIEVIEPAGSSSMPTQEELEMQRIKIEKEMQRKKEKENKSKWKSLKQIKKAICEKILPQSVSSRYSGHQNSSSAKSSSPMATSSPAEGATSTESSTLTEMSPGNIKETSEKHSNVSGDKIPVSDGSEHGASGWRELNRTQNDLNANVDMETKHSEGFSDKFNICESDSKVFRAKTNNLMNKTRSTSATVSNIGDKYSADKPFEDSIYCNNIGDNKSNGKNIDLKPGCSYEMKEIKCKSDESENECLISKTDKVNDNTEVVKCHDTARSGEKETDALMSSFNET